MIGRDKEDFSDKSLCAAVDEMSRGLIDANLVGGLVKKRIARPGAGKSSGFRTLLALKRLAAVLLGMDANAINKLLADKELKEICKNEK
jgi:hypothetical protein